MGILTSLLVNHSIPLEERAKINCACVGPALMYAAETWALTERLEGLLASCDDRILRTCQQLDGRTRLPLKRSEGVGWRTLNID